MGANKVIVDGETIVDLTGDTATPETVAEGVTFHGADGSRKVGTMSVGGDVSTEAIQAAIDAHENNDAAHNNRLTLMGNEIISVKNRVAELEENKTGGGSVTVTVEGMAGTASHTAMEIYTLIQNGNTVVATIDDGENCLYNYCKYNAPIAANAMRASVEFIHNAIDENGIITTSYIIIHDDGSADAGYYEGSGGITPQIGTNGNWFIGDEDTGVSAAGAYVTRLDEMGGDATKTTYRMVFSDGKGYDFDVYHGKDGKDADPYTLTEADKVEIVDEVTRNLGGEVEQVDDITLIENAYDENSAMYNYLVSEDGTFSQKNGSLAFDVDLPYDTEVYCQISGLDSLFPNWSCYLTVSYLDANKNNIGSKRMAHTNLINDYDGSLPCGFWVFLPNVTVDGIENTRYIRMKIGIADVPTVLNADNCRGLVVKFAKKTHMPTHVKSIPSHWSDEIAEKTEAVRALQSVGGKNCVTFAVVSDPHIPNNATGRTDYLGKVMGRMLDNCDAPFAIVAGDVGTRGSMPTEEEYLDVIEQAREHLSPLWGTDRLLVALGNHDGVYGDASQNMNLGNRLSQEKTWNTFFREQALDFRRVFSDNGLYFYVDNIPQKTRFIVLNSHYAANRLDKTAYQKSCYGQEQLDWLADVALDMSSGYGAVIVAHVAPRKVNDEPEHYTKDYYQLVGIINAYINKKSYSGSYSDADGYANSQVSVDFSGANGEIMAMFTGHEHRDILDTETLDCPIITLCAAGAPANGTHASYIRPYGTGKETSFDVVTINRATKMIYCTRVGAGSDRAVSYAKAEIKTYTVTWVVDGKTTTETYNDGDTPSFKGSTNKASDGQYTYTFTGWSPAISPVTANVTYTAQYSKTEIPQVPETYTVTNSLTNCTNSNSATTVTEGSSYSATITANEGYTLDSVSVTMGGNAVSVTGGSISIASVTGNIVVTASASQTSTEPSYTNLAQPTDEVGEAAFNAGRWTNNARMGSGADYRGDANSMVTNLIQINDGDVIYFANTGFTKDGNGETNGVQISLKQTISGAIGNLNNGTPELIEKSIGSNYIHFTYYDDGTIKSMHIIRGFDTNAPYYFRLCLASTVDKSKVIITRNEPIE